MSEKTRNELIHEKGFKMFDSGIQYNKIKIGPKVLEDAVLKLGSLNTIESKQGKRFTKIDILRALAQRDLTEAREISEFFYFTNGIYEKACNHYANLYRYDWYVVPEIYESTDELPEDKINREFCKILNFFDNSYIKKLCSNIALEVIVKGAYYGYIVPSADGLILQQLPINYCRSRYNIANKPAIEFNMKFFDDAFKDINYRMRVLKMFPAEFAKGYVLYKQNKLTPDFQGDTGCWYLLDPDATVKFNLHNSDFPVFANAIPAFFDLDAAQDLERRKQMQKLLKIIIQKLPRDKNGDLIFDMEEARDIHNNAVEMLSGGAVGLDVLTTFADIDAIDISDRNTAAAVDELEKMERTLFNALGMSQNLFNTDGNIALEKSVLGDEATMRELILQFNIFFNNLIKKIVKNRKKYNFKLYMLETTQYNYKEMSKMYKEQVQLGYSKMLPQIALGHSQSAIINTAYFENDVLHLNNIMIPPLSSNVMNAETLGLIQDGDNEGGRPEKDDGEKSEKTIQNLESMS